MDTPDSTLLVVLQVVSAILALLMFIAAKQARQRKGLALWVAGFAVHGLSQIARELVGLRWGHQASLPIGHVGGPLAYALLYMGIRRYLGLPSQARFLSAMLLLAAALSIAAVSQHANFVSLSLTACIAAMFQALTATTLWASWRRSAGLARVGAAVVFALAAGVSLARAVAIASVWNMEATTVSANSFWLLAFIALNILQAGSLLFLLNQSLLDELQNLADHDTLTGLLNRGGLSRRVRHQRRRMDGSGALCMDLDHFKSVNDTHGHGAGDDVLKCLGELLRENSRPMDLPSRQGGEEFGVIVEAASAEELLCFAERLRAAVEAAPFPTRMGPIPVTISIGAAFAGSRSEAIEDLAERADHALMQAKREGRNRVVLAS